VLGELIKGYDWELVFLSIVLIYFYSHYLFASNTAHVSAMYADVLSRCPFCRNTSLTCRPCSWVLLESILFNDTLWVNSERCSLWSRVRSYGNLVVIGFTRQYCEFNHLARVWVYLVEGSRVVVDAQEFVG